MARKDVTLPTGNFEISLSLIESYTRIFGVTRRTRNEVTLNGLTVGEQER